jgi:ariadne-1
VELEDKPKSRTKKKVSVVEFLFLVFFFFSDTLQYECLICTEEFSGKDTFALGCGHRYCLACWKSYLEVAIKEGAEGIWAKCPAPKCPAITHEEAWKKLVDKSTFKTYTKYLTRGLVTGNPLIKFCPAPGCSNAIRCERKGRREAVKCSCGYGFCFQCADYDIGDHMPATCENVRQWQERASSESENIKWLIANTKRCPTCGKPIEKVRHSGIK